MKRRFSKDSSLPTLKPQPTAKILKSNVSLKQIRKPYVNTLKSFERPLGEMGFRMDRSAKKIIERARNAEKVARAREFKLKSQKNLSQKTLKLDGAQIDAILGALCGAKQTLAAGGESIRTPCALSSCGAALPTPSGAGFGTGEPSAANDKIVSIESLLRTRS